MHRAVWTLLLVFFASTATAQSLAEVAKKEKERRKKVATEESEPITEQDLARSYRGLPPLTSSTSSSATTAEDEEGETEGTAAEEETEAPPDPRRTEDYWRGRLRPIDERIQRLEADLASPLYTNNPRGASERQRLERDLARARADRQALVDEARRAGAPPGWLR